MASSPENNDLNDRKAMELRAEKCVSNLVNARAKNVPLCATDISNFLRVIVDYGNAKSKRFPPTKEQFSRAVNAILMAGDTKLSPQWNKSQLAACLTRWLNEALLIPFNKQADLFAKVQSSKRDPKELEHSVFLVDEDSGNVSTFEILTPSTNPPTTPRASPSPSLTSKAGDEGFLAELDRLMNSPSLAAIPVIPTPRVETAPQTPRSTTVTLEAANSEGAVPLNNPRVRLSELPGASTSEDEFEETEISPLPTQITPELQQKPNTDRAKGPSQFKLISIEFLLHFCNRNLTFDARLF